MSAFIVSAAHIDLLVSFAVKHGVRYETNGRTILATPEIAEEIGQILADENYRSVNHRYQERTKGHFGSPETYKFKPAQLLPAIVILKQVACYAYQACETENWEQSVAFAICEAIKDAAIPELPGYAAAPWGID